MWYFSAFVVFMRHAGWSFYSIHLFFVWRGVALRVALRGHWGGTLVAFTVFVLFMECWGWTFVAFTAFVAFIRRSGWSFWWRLEC